MGGLFSIDGLLYKIMKWLSNILFLSIFWLICCIPIITIGPSTAALYYVSLKIARKEDPSVLKSFFHSFKDNFKQGVLLTLIFLLVGFILYADYFIVPNMTGSIQTVLKFVLLFIGLVYLMITSYTFPLLAQFENTIGQTLKNAFLLSVRHFPRTIIIILFNVLPVLALVFLTELVLQYLPVYLFLVPGFIASLCAKHFCKIFKPLMEPAEEEA